MECLSNFFKENSDLMITIAIRAVITIGILIACAIISRIFKKAIKASGEKEKMDLTLVPVLSSVATITTYVVGAVFILNVFNVNTAGIVALIGAAGIAIGFALKDTLSNIAAGVMLLMLRPFRTGDAVQFAGTAGILKYIHFFTTSI